MTSCGYVHLLGRLRGIHVGSGLSLSWHCEPAATGLTVLRADLRSAVYRQGPGSRATQSDRGGGARHAGTCPAGRQGLPVQRNSRGQQRPRMEAPGSRHSRGSMLRCVGGAADCNAIFDCKSSIPGNVSSRNGQRVTTCEQISAINSATARSYDPLERQ